MTGFTVSTAVCAVGGHGTGSIVVSVAIHTIELVLVNTCGSSVPLH